MTTESWGRAGVRAWPVGAAAPRGPGRWVAGGWGSFLAALGLESQVRGRQGRVLVRSLVGVKG